MNRWGLSRYYSYCRGQLWGSLRQSTKPLYSPRYTFTVTGTGFVSHHTTAWGVVCCRTSGRVSQSLCNRRGITACLRNTKHSSHTLLLCGVKLGKGRILTRPTATLHSDSASGQQCQGRVFPTFSFVFISHTGFKGCPCSQMLIQHKVGVAWTNVRQL